jgi:hypothetical protein
MQEGIGRGQSADSAAISLPAHKRKESVWIAGNDAIEHLPVLVLDPSKQARRDRIGISKAGPHVGEVDPCDEADRPLLRFEEITQDLKESLDLWVIRGELSVNDPFLKRVAQDREDPDGSLGPNEVLEQDDLEFNGVLGPMGNVIHSEDIGTTVSELLQQIMIRRNGAEWCLEILRANSKGLRGSSVGRPKDDE